MEISNQSTSGTGSAPAESGSSTSQSAGQESSSSSQSSQTSQSVQTAQSVQSGDTAGDVNGPQHPEQASWSPDFKFKVMGKEQEIPEFLREAIKNADSEKQVKEIFEKAYGLDVVKPRFLETREKLQSTEQRLSTLSNNLNQLEGMINKNDFKGFFQALKIPKEKIFQYALSELQYDELPPEQKQYLEQQQAMTERLAHAEQLISNLSQEKQTSVVQARGQQVDQILANDQVSNVAKRFDSAMAQKGSNRTFRDLVIEQGYLMSEQSGKDTPAQDAVQRALEILSYGQSGMAEQPGQAAAPSLAVSPGAAKSLPVIPHVAGRNTSPTRQAPKSIDDLKKRYKELNN